MYSTKRCSENTLTLTLKCEQSFGISWCHVRTWRRQKLQIFCNYFYYYSANARLHIDDNCFVALFMNQSLWQFRRSFRCSKYCLFWNERALNQLADDESWTHILWRHSCTHAHKSYTTRLHCFWLYSRFQSISIRFMNGKKVRSKLEQIVSMTRAQLCSFEVWRRRWKQNEIELVNESAVH